MNNDGYEKQKQVVWLKDGHLSNSWVTYKETASETDRR